MSLIVSRRALIQAAALLPAIGFAGQAAGEATSPGFTHGVASGDPGQREVTLWTRFVPVDMGEATLRVDIAEDERFDRIVSRGSARCGPSSDHCAHARADNLKPGRWYHYRFRSEDGAVSVTGRTRTLPSARTERFKIGVLSCANATSGWFNAYAHAAARDDLDLLIHTGDYIYESPTDRSDALAGLALARGIAPKGEAVSLADYRLRYASYRDDPALQELHRRYPMIAIWDDHEVANNSWTGGASNHQPEDGRWEDRVAAGRRAWREWMPMRGTDYERYQIGDLATLFRIETRLTGRTKQLDAETALAGASDMAKAVAAFRAGPLAAPERTMMGAAQEQWLADGLAASVRDDARWQILAQQVIMSPMRLPPVSPTWFAPGTRLDPEREADLARSVALGKLGMPISLDRWDGYPAARARLLDAAARAGAELVVLSGDSHNAWGGDLASGGRPIGVELAGQSVSSLGIERRFGGDPKVIAADFVASNAALRWCDTSRRGYMIVDVTQKRVAAEWVFVPSRGNRSVVLEGSHTMIAERGARRLSAV